MIPTERTQLSWILKNSEKQENRKNGFYLYFLFFTVFLKRITYAAPPPVPARQLLPLRNCLAGAGGGVEIRWQMCVRIVEGRGRGWPVT